MLFLLHTGVDLLFPELCSEEVVGAGLSQSLVFSDTESWKDSPAVAASDSKKSKDEQPSDPQHRDEDCFCCCTHVMPSSLFVSPGNPEFRVQTIAAENSLILSIPLNTPYHPPRTV